LNVNSASIPTRRFSRSRALAAIEQSKRIFEMRKVKAILIDPFACTVTEVEHDADD
jgi:hypothetical protein